ncbi:hypothetical protein OH492_02685 [Vibrio chagasii]|nr:hypothetical protein [Vibrio chagasii]
MAKQYELGSVPNVTDRRRPLHLKQKRFLAASANVCLLYREAITGDEVSEEATEESATAESDNLVVWRLPSAECQHCIQQ